MSTEANPAGRIQLGMDQKTREIWDKMLFDPKAGRVPKGAYAEWVALRIHEWHTHTQLQLERYGFKPGEVIYGEDKTILKIKNIFDDAMKNV